MDKETAHKGYPCIYCGVPHDDVPRGPCRAKATLTRIMERLEKEKDVSADTIRPSFWLSAIDRCLLIVREEGEK